MASRLRGDAAGLLLLIVTAAAETGSHAWPAPLRTLTARVRIGADHNPPYYYLHPDGTVSGLGVDVLNAAASRAGVQLEWVQIPDSISVHQALDNNYVDLWPAAGSTPERLRKYHFTEPWLTNDFCLLSRAAAGIRAPADLAGRKVSAWFPCLYEQLARRSLPDASIILKETRGQAVEAVCRREADASMVEARFLANALLKRSRPCVGLDLDIALLPGVRNQMSLISRHSAAPVADFLRDRITELAVDGILQQIMGSGPRCLPPIASSPTIWEKRAGATSLSLIVWY